MDKAGKLPALCQVHYESPVKGAANHCAQGWAVVTPHYGSGEGEHALEAPVGDSYNLARAIIQWTRRLPFIDRSRLHITGGSAGGYMTLAMAADAFPVTSLVADAPVVNWDYTLNHIEANKPISLYGTPDAKKESPLPVLCAVTMIADWCFDVFGTDLAEERWYRLSPIAYLNRITCPASVLCATGDMLVPVGQFTADHVYPFDPAQFPEGYANDFQTLTLNDASRKTFVEVLPEDALFIHLQERPEDLHEFTRANVLGEDKETPQPDTIDRPVGEG